MKKVLVTGACGYIGAHTVKALAQEGCIVDALDIKTSKNDITQYIRKFVRGDVTNNTVYWGRYDAVIHLAGLLSVEESVAFPTKYVHNNIIGTQSILKHAPTENFIFASTASAFSPYASPYAQTKLLCEGIIKEYAQEHKTEFTIFRFFNVAGNNGEFNQIGESTHLIRVAAETAAGRRKFMNLYGTDWDTKDGTCVRDYIHVSDLVDGIIKAVHKPKNTDYECAGTGQGYTCLEVIDMMKKVSRKNFDVIESSRRNGDVAVSIISDDIKKSDYIDCNRSLHDICLSSYLAEILNK